MRLRRRVPRIHREGRNIIVGLTFERIDVYIFTQITLVVCCYADSKRNHVGFRNVFLSQSNTYTRSG